MPIEISGTTASGYDDALTLGGSQQFATVIFNNISGNDALYQIAKKRQDGTVFWDENELTAGPGVGSFLNCYGIRFRDAKSGTHADIVADAFYSDDPTPVGFTPSKVTTPSSVTYLGRFTPAQWPPQNPANGDLASYVDLGVTWLMEYQSATNNWRINNGDTAPVFNSVYRNTTVSTNFVAVTLGVGGAWSIISYFSETQVSTSGASGLGSSSGATDIMPLTSPAGGRYDAITPLTYNAARGAGIYPVISLAGGLSPLLIVSFAPVTLLNA